MIVRMGDYKFPVMQDIIPEGKSGDYAVEHFTVSEQEADLYLLRATYNFDYLGRHFEKGDFCRLKMKDSLITSDGGGERWSTVEVCNRAMGNILIAGLGIGMMLCRIVPKPEVESVTVVEISPDVINLVEEHIREYLGEASQKLEIVLGDIWEFVPAHKYNTMWFDIWGDYSGNTYEETKRLHKRFQKYVDRSSPPFVDSWMRWHMKELHFKE